MGPKSAPVWPTNTIRICQSDSHTFTVLSQEAVTITSAAAQYARSEMVLVGRGRPGGLSTASCACLSPCHNWRSFADSPHVPHVPAPPPSRFVQIPLHIYESPGMQIEGEHGGAAGRKAAQDVVGRQGPQS